MSSLPVISLFSGAGGLDLGVEDAGGSVAVHVEPDPSCVSTLEQNRRFFPGARVIPRPIEAVPTDEILATAGVGVEEAALLVGGPPCQPFSKSGYWLGTRRDGLRDPRAVLLNEYVRVLRQARPAGFIFENVPSLTHPSNRPALDSLVRRARRYGYNVTTALLRAVEYGVPQTRVRLFVVGLRGGAAPPPPLPTHGWDRTNGARLRPPETAGTWIAPYSGPEFAEPNEVPSGKWLRHLEEVPPGWNYKWHTSWAGHRAPSFVAESRYWSFLLKLSPRRPSWTIQASAGPWTGPLHWDSRRLRVPELAALQTFPRGFEFAGRRTEKRRQLGNAVPPLLASRVAGPLLEMIAGYRPRSGRRLRYRLADGHEFDPSLARSAGRAW